MKFALAFRNIRRNGRRTILNLLMIGGSCAAIINFQGIARDSVARLETVAINNQFGHLQLASDKFWNPVAGEKPKARLLDLRRDLKSDIETMPEVAYASGRLTFFGLVSRGDESLSAKGIGYDPAVETRMRESMTIIQGRNLDPVARFEAILGAGLMKQLGVKVGDSLTLLAYTYDGAVNAIDVEFVGIFQTGISEVDNSSFYVPLTLAQKLMDTDRIDNLMVQLNDTSMTDTAVEVVQAKAAAAGYLGVTAKPWYELATQYQKVKNLCEVINQTTLSILIALALLAVGNTVGMSISERTGEIGTARALGFKARDIVQQFALEGLGLGLLGGVLGCAVGYVTGLLVTALRIPLETPGASVARPIVVDIQPQFLAFAFTLTCLMAVCATLIPALKASRLDIVDALRRSI